MTRAPDDTCENCPAWCRLKDQSGGDITIPVLDPTTRQPVVKDGVVQILTDAQGRPVVAGSCRLLAPVVMVDGMSRFPSSNSDWWCLQSPRATARVE